MQAPALKPNSIKHRKRILIADPDMIHATYYGEALSNWFVWVDRVGSNEDLHLHLERHPYDLVLVDTSLYECELVSSLRNASPGGYAPTVILNQREQNIALAVDAMHHGYYDVFGPDTTMPQALQSIADALGVKLQTPEESWDDERKPLMLETASQAMADLYQRAYWAATSDANVILTGETGTGKEVMARLIHNFSKRANGPFVSINCGAIPEDLLESEMFGHVEGAFSGAVRTRKGRLEMADGGTIFLDEIGEMNLNQQVKLLRFLQTKELMPVGGTATRKVNCRIICATNANLKEMVEEGEFRSDLYFRVNVIPLQLLPLRKRREDIPRLADTFLRVKCEERGLKLTGFSEECLVKMENYDWPGNIRELENVVDRATLFQEEGAIGLDTLPPRVRDSQSSAFLDEDDEADIAQANVEARVEFTPVNLGDLITHFEETLIQEALNKSGLKKKQAATLLTMNRTTLLEKIKKSTNLSSYLEQRRMSGFATV